MSIDYTILGVLIETPSHGYSIKKYLLENFSKDFGLNDGQLYPALARLESRGWIRKRVVPQPRSPARHLYRITPKGEEAFSEWLGSAEGDPETARYDFYWKHRFLQRCSFFRHLEAEDVGLQARRELEEASRKIEDLDGVLERMEARRADPYRRMVVDYGIRYQRMRCEWLRDLLAFADAAAQEPSSRVAARAR